MSSKSKGTEYEKYIEKICKSINSYRCFTLIELTQNKIIKGTSGVSHQIDVYWEFVLDKNKYKCIFECKNYNSKISKDKIATLDSISKDIPDSLPIIVSTKGFQSGAKEYAKAKGVTPFICRVLKDDDLQDRVRSFEIHLIILGKPKVNVKVTKDDQWCKENGYNNFNMTKIKDFTICDYSTQQSYLLYDFIENWIKSNYEDRTETIHFDNAFLVYELDSVNFKFTDLIVSVIYEKTEEVIRVNGDDYVQGLLIDVLNNHRSIVYKTGEIKPLD